MKNVSAGALVHPPTTLNPHARPGLGYICGLWVLLCRYHRLCPICLPFILFSILSSIILWLDRIMEDNSKTNSTVNQANLF